MFAGSLICEGAKSDKLQSKHCYRITRLRTERRGNQCSEERAEPEGVANGPVATSDTTQSNILKSRLDIRKSQGPRLKAIAATTPSKVNVLTK